MTILTSHNGVLREYPISGDYKLGDRVFDYGYSGQHTVYAYVINRNPGFAHRFYGWALPRE